MKIRVLDAIYRARKAGQLFEMNSFSREGRIYMEETLMETADQYIGFEGRLLTDAERKEERMEGRMEERKQLLQKMANMGMLTQKDLAKLYKGEAAPKIKFPPVKQ